MPEGIGIGILDHRIGILDQGLQIIEVQKLCDEGMNEVEKI